MAVSEWAEFTERIGYGGITEPGATPGELVEVWESIASEARDHVECPQWCDICGWWEKPRSCERCNGSGCSPATALGAYDPCRDCDGDGRAHIEYTLNGHKPTTEALELEARAIRAEQVAADQERMCLAQRDENERLENLIRLQNATIGKLRLVEEALLMGGQSAEIRCAAALRALGYRDEWR